MIGVEVPANILLQAFVRNSRKAPRTHPPPGDTGQTKDPGATQADSAVTTDPVLDELVARLGSICLALPEAYEEPAWTGTRWRVRSNTFAHVLTIENGWPPAYARAADVGGPAHVVMLRSAGAELEVLRHAGTPFFATPWRSDEIGMHLTADVDWAEVAELVAESYRTRAPQRLARMVAPPEVPDDPA